MNIRFVTGNSGKHREVSAMLPCTVEQRNVGYPEIQADALQEVARYGLDWLRTRVDRPYMLEDAGLFIDGLEGFPGVYSAYAYRTIGNAGILRLLDGAGCRDAVFRSVIGLDDGEQHFFTGECPGSIATDIRGEHGFGYDPIFIPEGSDRTFAEMKPAEKNRYSHRGSAIQKLAAYLSALP
ncbi:MAG: XTP/dITP diphosphatase [Thermoplasmatota archaeon]